MTEKRRVLLVASPGGHLLQMLALEPAWGDRDRVWVTLERADANQLLAGEKIVFAHGPTVRNVANFLRNVCLAWVTIRRYKPEALLSTGAALAVPFFLVGRLCGVRLVYVESFTRVSGPGLSGKLVYPLTDEFFVQWPSALGRRRARYAGSVV